MHYKHVDPNLWHFVPVKPGAEAIYHRWDVAIISMLAALFVGLLLNAL